MKICVQGLWHLGSVTAAALASIGHEVIGLDAGPDTVAALNLGRAPVQEPGLDALLRAGLDSGRLSFTTQAQALPDDLELLWVCHDTPVDDNDVADVEFVVSNVTSVLPHLPRRVTVLVSSQLPVGSIARLEALARALRPLEAPGFACSPENLRLGKALEVFLRPDRIVVGTRSQRDRDCIARALQPLGAPVEWMTVESAEMTKHAINAFLATSVVFANELATLCERVGADAKEVERGLKSEQRIGPRAYVSPGAAFAGGTLARDIEFLKEIGRRHEQPVPVLEAVRASNDAHKHWARGALQAALSDLAGVRVAVWGLTYKPGTDTLRRSLSVEVCDWLLEQGSSLTVHDPAVRSLPSHWAGRVQRAHAPLEALAGAQALVVGTEWPDYRQVDPAQRPPSAAPLLVIDANRFLSSWAAAPGVRVLAVGVPRSRGA